MDGSLSDTHIKCSGMTKQVVVFLTPDPQRIQDCEYAKCSVAYHTTNLNALGAEVRSMPWTTSPSPDEQSCIYVANLVWGYHQVPDQWYTWLHAWPKTMRLVNSVSLLLWNSRKTYLKDLEQLGVPIIPTLFVDHVDESTLIEATKYFKTNDLIVKPDVSASSFNTLRVLVGRDDDQSAPKSVSVDQALQQLRQSNSSVSMMIQPFMKNINREGEISVLVFAGKVSHVVLKRACRDDFRVQFEFGGESTSVENPSNEIIELTRRTLAACPELPTYARIDMVRNDSTGVLSISELELIEPELFLDYEANAGMTFARAILDRT